MADYCDGSVFRNHPLFSVDPTALQITLYYDEVEIVNPLGSKTGKHKLGNYLMTFGKTNTEKNTIQLSDYRYLKIDVNGFKHL